MVSVAVGGGKAEKDDGWHFNVFFFKTRVFLLAGSLWLSQLCPHLVGGFLLFSQVSFAQKLMWLVE